MTAPLDARIAEAKAINVGNLLVLRGIKMRGRRPNLSGPCPRCGGKDRFAAHTTRGVFNCRGCGAKGSGAVDFVMFLDNLDFLGAVETLAGPGPRQGSRAPPKLDPDREAREAWAAKRARAEAESAAEEARKLALAAKTWEEAGPIWLTPGWDYLLGRGIDLADIPDHGGLRWHPECPWERGTAPCVLWRYTDVLTCEPRGIGRRPVYGDGKPRSLGPTGGACVRLWPDDMVEQGLVLSEGIETGLAAATRITRRNTLLQPLWAAGSSGNMAAFPVLAGIDCLTILADHDESKTGETAAKACAARWRAAGREVGAFMPGELGKDFNDVVPR